MLAGCHLCSLSERHNFGNDLKVCDIVQRRKYLIIQMDRRRKVTFTNEQSLNQTWTFMKHCSEPTPEARSGRGAHQQPLCMRSSAAGAGLVWNFWLHMGEDSCSRLRLLPLSERSLLQLHFLCLKPSLELFTVERSCWADMIWMKNNKIQTFKQSLSTNNCMEEQ